MARAIERIEQDIAALEEAIALLATEFHSTYSKYLTFLGQSVRQQLIFASYQVCTQGYPESFLSLSFSQRQRLQEVLRQLAGRTQAQLLSHAEPAKNLPETASEGEPESSLERSPDPEQSQEATQEPLAELEIVEADLDPLVDESEPAASANTELSKPEQLVRWQEQLEDAIAQTLQATSLEANRLLQQTGIIPDKLPAAVLEAASKVDAAVEATSGAPNLLNLLMETETDSDSENSTLTRVVAINLRLSEIEFADPNLSAGRNQIRKLATRVRTFQGEYQKKQRERAVAQAEAAWRSSWFDD